MKKLTAVLLATAICFSLAACGGSSNADEVKSTNQSVADSVPTEPEEYGALQEIVDTYGFPIYLRMTEGMELTEVVLHEDFAVREWMSSMDGSSLYEDLSWSIRENRLTISGEWSDAFAVNAEAGRAYSEADGKEYRIVTYDDAGEVEFRVE